MMTNKPKGDTNGSAGNMPGVPGTRGTQEIAEAQRERYEALAENFASSGQQGLEFAEEGLEVLRLQESGVRATQEWLSNGVKLLELQQRNARFVQNWFGAGIGILREQTERNRRTAEIFANSAQKQQEGLRKLAEDWAGAYQDFFSYSPFSPLSYMSQARSYAQEGLKAAEQVGREGLEVTRQASRQGLRVAEEAAEQTGRAIEQAEEATHQAELQAVVVGALKTKDYEKLSVEEVSSKLDELSVSELEKVREYEKQGHDRQTLVGQIDQKIRAKS